jgi:hypothetical protein
MAQRTVDDYIAGLPDWRGDVVTRLRRLVREAAPEATEAIKWGQPVWSSNGPSVHVKAFARSVNLGFWRGAELDDPDGLLSGDGTRMKHLRLTSSDDLDDDRIRDFVRQAIELNRVHGDPTRR